jgi:hypothetical protein
LFATSAVYTSDKFAAGVIDTGGKIAIGGVSTTLAKLVEKRWQFSAGMLLS